MYHQTVHFFSGFILLPLGQLKSFAKSSLLLSGPIVLNACGEWVSLIIWDFRASSVFTAHQPWKLNLCWKLSLVKLLPSSYSNFPSKILTEESFIQTSVQDKNNLLERKLSKIIALKWMNALAILVQNHVFLPTFLKRQKYFH